MDIGVNDFRKNVSKMIPQSLLEAWANRLPAGYTLTSFALRYALDLFPTHTIVGGGHTFEHYEQATQALSLPPLDFAALQLAEEMRSAFRHWYDGGITQYKKILRGLIYVRNQVFNTGGH
jgi:hypothetical protein